MVKDWKSIGKKGEFRKKGVWLSEFFSISKLVENAWNKIMWFLKTLVAWFWRKKLEKIGKVSERKVGIPKNKGVVF